MFCVVCVGVAVDVLCCFVLFRIVVFCVYVVFCVLCLLIAVVTCSLSWRLFVVLWVVCCLFLFVAHFNVSSELIGENMHYLD